MNPEDEPKARDIVERVGRCLDLLEHRIERNSMLPGADAVHLTTLVGAFHKVAGDIERNVRDWVDDFVPGVRASYLRHFAAELRNLRRHVNTYGLLRRHRAAHTAKR